MIFSIGWCRITFSLSHLYVKKGRDQFVLSASAFSLQPRQPSACRLSTILYAAILHYCDLLIPERVRGIILHPTPLPHPASAKGRLPPYGGILPCYMPAYITTVVRTFSRTHCCFLKVIDRIQCHTEMS